MNRFLFCAVICAVLCALLTLPGGPPRSAAAQEAVTPVHDPCLIKADGVYYVFSTGPGIPIRRSKDLTHWEAAGRVFAEDVPAWAKTEIPDARALWAPDVSYFNHRFHVYYSVSSFGKNRSLIGAVSTPTLDSSRPDYKWTDDGKVFESFPSQNFNAIDPNIVFPGSGRLALAFGSFWSGIQLLELDPRSGRPAAGASLVPLARRPEPPDAIEAPFLVRHGAYFYLFTSFDFCCRGVNSNYNIRVGRAKKVDGPYEDRDGKRLTDGGGTLILGTEGTQIGPGHCAVLHEKKRDLLAYHFYDGSRNGVPTLQVRPLVWSKDGWPTVAAPFKAEADAGIPAQSTQEKKGN